MKNDTLYNKYTKKAGHCFPTLTGLIPVWILLLLVFMSACRRDDLCFFHPDGAYLVVEIDWQKLARVKPNAATILLYNADNGTLFREEILTTDRNRHILRDVPVGRYDIVVFNETRTGSHFDQSIGFRNYTRWVDFEAYVFPDEIGSRYAGLGFVNQGSATRTLYTNPDTLAAERLTGYEVTPQMINIVHTDPEPIDHGKQYPISDTIRFTPQRVISVVNVVLKGTNLASIKSYSCYLSGMCEAYTMGPGVYSMNPVTYPVVFTTVNRKSLGGNQTEVTSLTSSFSVMGLQGDISPEEYEHEDAYVADLRLVLMNDNIQMEKIDLIKNKGMTRIRKYVNGMPHDRIDIELKVDLPDMPVTGGGLITDIEDWDDQTVPLETTVLRFHPNQGSGNMIPVRGNINQSVTLPVCSFKPPTQPEGWTFTFKEWNTANDGTGTAYQPGSLFKMPKAGIILYAIWNPVKPS